MTQILIVLAAAVFTYLLFGWVAKVAGVLASTTLEIFGFNIPALFALIVTFAVGTVAWMLLSAFGIKTAGMAGTVAIEAFAFYSLCRSATPTGSASLWLINAFALGGLFIFCVALLA